MAMKLTSGWSLTAAQARVEARPALDVQLAKAVEPEGRARPRPHADFQDENLRRQLPVLVEVAEQRPEVGHRTGDGDGVVRIGPAARQRLLEPPPRYLLPRRQVLPEEPVETPDEALPQGDELFQQDVPPGVVAPGRGGRQGAGESPPPRCRAGPAGGAGGGTRAHP